MLSALSLFRQKPSFDRKMHNLIPYRPCLSSDTWGTALHAAAPSDASCWKTWYQKHRKMREIDTNQPVSQCSHFIAKEVRKRCKKVGLEELQVRKQKRPNHSASVHLFGHKTCAGCRCKTRKPEKNCKSNFTKRKPAKENVSHWEETGERA